MEDFTCRWDFSDLTSTQRGFKLNCQKMVLYYDVGTNRFSIHTNVYIYDYIYTHVLQHFMEHPFFPCKNPGFPLFSWPYIGKSHGKRSFPPWRTSQARSAAPKRTRSGCCAEWKSCKARCHSCNEAQTRDTKGFKWPSKWENIGSWMYITRDNIYIIYYIHMVIHLSSSIEDV